MSFQGPNQFAELADQISKVIDLVDAPKFQQFLNRPDVFCHKGIIKILSDILAANIFSKDQKVIAASAFNLIYHNLFGFCTQFTQNVNRCWNEYFACLMDRNDDDLINWSYIHNTINGLCTIVAEKSAECNNSEMNFLLQKFHQTNFQGRLMLMHANIACSEIEVQNKLLFIRQSIEQFLVDALAVIKNIHGVEGMTPEMIKVQRDTVIVLNDSILLLENMNHCKDLEGSDCLYLLSQNKDLIEMIKLQLGSFLHKDNGVLKYIKTEKPIELFDRILIDQNGGREFENMMEDQLEIKAFAINLLQFLTQSYESTAAIEDFDNFPVLILIEALAPVMIEELVGNNVMKENCLKENHMFDLKLKYLATSILSILKRMAQFNFLFQTFKSNNQKILYNIFYYYLKTTELESIAYEQDPQEFINLSDSFIEATMENDVNTPKDACGIFMKFFFDLDPEALAEYLQFLAASLRYRELGENSEIIMRAKENQHQIPESEMIWTVIAKIYFAIDQSNHEVRKFIYDNFFDQEIVFKMTGIAKARVLLFLMYCYPKYYAENPLDGVKFIKWTSETKQNSKTQFKIVMKLLAVVYDYGIPEQVWDFVNQEIQRTNRYQVFSLIKDLVHKGLNQINPQSLYEVTKLICKRVKNQFTKFPPQHFLNHEGNDYSIFIKCFHILQKISQSEVLVSEYGIILEQIMDLVDFFHEKQDVEQFQFVFEIIALLNNILKIQEEVPIDFQRYLTMLERVVKNRRDFGPLLKTYFSILGKAELTFQKNPNFLIKIQQSLENHVLEPSNWKHQQLIFECLFLLSSILLVYNDMTKENRQVFVFTQSVLQNEIRENTTSQKLCASILIYWMAGEFAFGDYELGRLNEFNIQIFKDQFGMMFSQCLRKLIEKHFNSESLETLLKLSIKLLDNETHERMKKTYRGPQFTISVFKDKELVMDPYQEIASAIFFLRERLDRDAYARAIDFMKNEYGNDELIELLSKRVINPNSRDKPRIIYTVRKQ